MAFSMYISIFFDLFYFVVTDAILFYFILFYFISFHFIFIFF